MAVEYDSNGDVVNKDPDGSLLALEITKGYGNAHTVLQVCNVALSYLHSDLVTDINDRSQASAIACVIHYNNSVTEVISAADWAFSTRIKPLVVATGTYANVGWKYAYVYPEHCIKILGIFTGSARVASNYVDYEIGRNDGDDINYDNVIFTNLKDALIRETFHVQDGEHWQADALRALEYKLASNIAMPLLGPQVGSVMRKRFDDIYKEKVKESWLSQVEGVMQLPFISDTIAKARFI